MKTQLLRLEAHDDPASIRDKLGWKQVGRVMLVLPGKGDAGLCNRLNNRLHLRLIQREAEKIGAQIAFITTHRGLEKTAKELGLPVFPSIKQAHKAHWISRDYALRNHSIRLSQNSTHQFLPRSAFEEEQIKHHPRLHIPEAHRSGSPFYKSIPFWITSITLGLVLIAIAGLLTLPRATIRVPLMEKTQSLQLHVVASTELSAVDIMGKVPLQTVTGIIKKKDQMKSTGMEVFPDRSASGSLKMTNLSPNLISLGKNTRLIVLKNDSKPVSQGYLLEKEVRLPGRTAIAEPISAVIRAENPGAAGNLPEGYYFALEGPNGASVVAFNPDPFQGGSDVRLVTPSTRDRETLTKSIRDLILQTANEEISQSKKSMTGEAAGILFPDSVELTKIISTEFVPAEEHTPSTILSLTMQIEYQGKIVLIKDINQLTVIALGADLQEGYTAAGKPDIKTTILKSNESDGFRFDLNASRQIKQNVDQAALIRSIRGKSIPEASQILRKNISIQQTPEIRLTPNWWKFLPLFGFQYELIEE